MFKAKEFTCKQCGAKGIKRSQFAPKFCDYKCRNAFLEKWRKDKRIHPEVACVVCGKVFTPYSKCKEPCCSMKCKLQKGIRKRKRKCKECGKVFSARSFSSLVSYCSKSCAGRASRLEPYTFKCLKCGTIKTLPRVSTRPRKFCSRACSDGFYAAEKSPLFRGNRRHYRGADWKTQARLARERDGNVCQSCGAATDEKLSVDHIVPFRLAYRYASTEEKNPNQLVNLVSLCRKCHSKKTRIETRLLRGDLVGFRAEIKALICAEKAEDALTYWGLGYSFTHPTGDFPPMPRNKQYTGTKLSVETMESIIFRRANGESVADLAREVGYRPSSLFHAISRFTQKTAEHAGKKVS